MKYFFAIILIALALGCTSKNEETADVILELNSISQNSITELRSNLVQSIPVSFTSEKIESKILFESQIKYIPLETTNESLFGDISQLIVTKDHFIILDKKTKSILIFNKLGGFIKKIQRVGRGPEEYYIPKSIKFNEESNLIEVSDNVRMILQRYDLDGNYVSTLNVGFSINEFEPIQESTYLFTVDSYQFNEQRYAQVEGLEKQILFAREIEGNSLKILSQHVDYIEGSGLLNYGIKRNIRRGIGNEMLINLTFNDTIYSYQDGNIKPKYVVAFGKDRIDPNFFKENSFRKIEEYYEKDLLPTVDVFWESNDFTFMWSSYQNRIGISFYSKASQNSISVWNSDFNTGAQAVANFPVGVNDTSLIYKVEPQNVHDMYKRLSDQVDRALSQEYNRKYAAKKDSLMREIIKDNGYEFLYLKEVVKANDNPVLAFIKPNLDLISEN